jgi:hypothetical protein
MFKFFKRVAVAALVTALANSAFAAEYQVTVQGKLAKDIFSTSFFGIIDPLVDVQISFIVDAATVTHLPAGTPVILSTGASFTSQAHLALNTSVRELVVSIGNASFNESELLRQNLGTSAYAYDILLLGNLAENGLTGVQLTLQNASGDLEFGRLDCPTTTCNILNIGSGVSSFEGSNAEMSNLQVFTQALLPPPSASTLITNLKSSIDNNTAIKTGAKAALNAHLKVTAFAIQKGNKVQALNSMKAFIGLLDPMVRGGQLTQAIADSLEAQALAIIAAI